ncbi:putative quinol monooxygenase [Acetobacterium wieringae]|uniref:Putative monooxygenase YcnE n=1 Tax=Acetobacterium wieringae TaxID=52694 RepID=A0A1F2PJB1_9FIRM|nr:putative quinol monooxygenase [Acetobacterium wieringae]MEA4807224.1 putative quinol monooxygenase [Acetobacterium wieringae]OFV70942.1 putative monooxygenase YcnE [Acetobacterium wieringae]URN84169.1 antibiotic biosynthesis monooxygenase [Acetobacterium wieringae]
MKTKENLLLNVTYTTKPGKRTEFIKTLTQLGVVEQSKQESGNIRYDYFYPLNSDDQLYLVEIWEDSKALALHTQTEHYKQLQSCKNEYLMHTQIEKFYICTTQ